MRVLSSADMKAFEPEAKVGILSTLDAEGEPHISLITSLRAKTPTQLMWGQFTEGRSKQHVRRDPKVGFAVMNAERRLWRGKARWTHALAEGQDYELFNRLPMFRYNSYLGIHTVHYMDLVALDAPARISLPRVAAGLAAAALTSKRELRTPAQPVLSAWSRRHLTKITTLFFLAYRDADGFPAVLPVVPCRAAGPDRLLFVASVYRNELGALPRGTTLAAFGLNLEMESTLVRGRFAGFGSLLGLPVGRIDLDWAYNTMPPVPGVIYPPEPLTPVTDFG